MIAKTPPNAETSSKIAVERRNARSMLQNARCRALMLLLGAVVFARLLPLSSVLAAQNAAPAEDALVKSVKARIRSLRSLPDDKRGDVTKSVALDVRRMSDPKMRTAMASSLANLATEGDFGHDTLQAVATTLEEALRANPLPANAKQLSPEYITLAQLQRYENVRVSLNDPQYAAAVNQLKSEDEERAKADFTLPDINGKTWTLKALRGKIVLVNFWATWCPPCRKELPDLEALYGRFKDKGLVVLGVTDEDAEKTVKPFVKEHALTYPILIDAGRKTGERFAVQGIPRTLIYDKRGKLAAQAIDMRTRKQLTALLRQAGLREATP